MHKLIMGVWFALTTSSVLASTAEVIAIGTSGTNCKGVASEEKFPAVLEKLLRAKGFDVVVKNAGVDGDKPYSIHQRLITREVNDHTSLVIYEPGPNDKNVAASVESIEKSLAWLQEKRIPVIYVSFSTIQPPAHAKATAEKFGATYYGYWRKDVPAVSENYLGDGHMSAKGCELWAKGVLPYAEDILRKKDDSPGN